MAGWDRVRLARPGSDLPPGARRVEVDLGGRAEFPVESPEGNTDSGLMPLFFKAEMAKFSCSLP